ncbi:MAG TPA: hypothetical protein PKL56_11935 [Cyclobacteriaceae bacterium]|nr:hypothetical protein [Cyclobacteriaceae bacterium]HMV07504.1 hypothetical protein [Cyclobacteriaceae bacterium]HMW99141.1 hypothetical protein [Cyclobacteriaceae bacterium]HMX48226.1 hypothetical protein [Cyclobacteriaceae bacterium]HMY95031.1 hypothetical protein [Cyclobacteriaceae bacterium]
MAKQPAKKKKPRVHKDLQGFEVSVNQFGELNASMSIDKINEFLNKNVEDKKLVDRDESEEPKTKKKRK